MSVQSAERSRKVWEGAFILTLAGLVTKVLSAGYRIPYQNIAGDIGFYIYQQAYPIYGIVLVFSTYGFPVIISKLLAEQLEEKNNESILKIIYLSFLTLSVIGFTLFGLLFWGAEGIANLMGDKQLVILLRVISFSFLLLPIISVLRGYFQGQKYMVPTAVSQVSEQFVRVMTILFMSFILLDNGYGAYEAGAGAIFGSITGGFAAILVLFYFLLKKGKGVKKRVKNPSRIKSTDIIKTLLTQGLTICMSALLLILFQLIDSFTVYSLLLSEGVQEEAAKQAKGIYDRGQPLIQLGTIVATSLSLSIVPLIASAKVKNDIPYIQKKVDLTVRLGVVVGLGAATGLAFVLEPTNIMLFKNNLGTNVLIVLGFSILFTTLSQIITAILQGLGNPYLPTISVLIGLFIKWALNLLFIPSFKTMGAAVSTVMAFAVITVLLFIIVRKKLPGALVRWGFIYKVMVATVAMGASIYTYLFLLHFFFPTLSTSRTFACFQALSSVVIGGVIYMFFIIRGNVFSKEELSLLPIGSKGASLVSLLKGGRNV
ncbi:putative polysaccharide biosynthesis protein [Fredinandcohnia humi]